MALTRKLLSALGIEADKVEQIIEAHTETVEALKKERDAYKADAEKLPEVQKELDGLKEVSKGDSTYKEQYEKEHQAFEDYKKEIEAKQLFEQKKAAYKELLRKCGVSEKRLEAVLRIAGVDEIELDESGKVKDQSALEKHIKEEFDDYIETKQNKGAETANPPANNGGNGGESYAAKRAAQLQAQMYGVAPKQE